MNKCIIIRENWQKYPPGPRAPETWIRRQIRGLGFLLVRFFVFAVSTKIDLRGNNFYYFFFLNRPLPNENWKHPMFLVFNLINFFTKVAYGFWGYSPN